MAATDKFVGIDPVQSWDDFDSMSKYGTAVQTVEGSKSVKQNSHHVYGYWDSSIKSLKAEHDPLTYEGIPQDTLEEAVEDKPQPEKKQNQPATVQIANFAKWVWGCIFGQTVSPVLVGDKTDDSDKTSTVGGTPKLEKPAEMDRRSLLKLTDELKAMTQRTKDINEDGREMMKDNPQAREAQLYLLLLITIKNQIKNKQAGELLTKTEIFRQQGLNKEIQQNYFSMLEDISKRASTSKVLGWVNVAIGGSLAAATGAAIVTGGLGGVLVVIPAVLSLVKGGIEIWKGVLKYENGLKTGEIEQLKLERTLNQEQIKKGIEHMADDVKAITNYSKDLAHLSNNRFEATRYTPT